MLRSTLLLSAMLVTQLADISLAADLMYCPKSSSTTKAIPRNPQPQLPSVGTPSARNETDPLAFFDRLVERYRKLHFYKDSARVVQVTNRDGEETNRIETQITCEIADGKLRLVTPTAQVRENLGLDLPLKLGDKARSAKEAYDLWLAPHMAMKFTEKPLKQLRAGVDEGFTPKVVEPVTIDNKPMVHVELRSGEDGSESGTAKFDLYVNSDSMLIERIEGEQKLPDGASYSTSVHITPEHSEPARPEGVAPAFAEPAQDVEPALPPKPPVGAAPRT